MPQPEWIEPQIKQRTELYPGEIDFFKKNPNVSGMAAEDNAAILNPYSSLSDDEKQSVLLNEKARILMRVQNIKPTFSLTPGQKIKFKNYGSEQDIK